MAHKFKELLIMDISGVLIKRIKDPDMIPGIDDFIFHETEHFQVSSRVLDYEQDIVKLFALKKSFKL